MPLSALRKVVGPPGLDRFVSAVAALVLMGALVQVPDPLAERLPPGPPRERREFHFTRAAYGGAYSGYWGRSWATDYPKADRQFMIGVRRLLTHLDASEYENPVRLDDPELRRFPFLYAVEVGYMSLSEPEVEGLRR